MELPAIHRHQWSYHSTLHGRCHWRAPCRCRCSFDRLPVCPHSHEQPVQQYTGWAEKVIHNIHWKPNPELRGVTCHFVKYWPIFTILSLCDTFSRKSAIKRSTQPMSIFVFCRWLGWVRLGYSTKFYSRHLLSLRLRDSLHFIRLKRQLANATYATNEI